jgi:ABC-type dipeptide/oligopeptide/nickel transport system permease subunit
MSWAPSARWWPRDVAPVTVSAFIMLGDAVRDALDPKLR